MVFVGFSMVFVGFSMVFVGFSMVFVGFSMVFEEAGQRVLIEKLTWACLKALY